MKLVLAANTIALREKYYTDGDYARIAEMANTIGKTGNVDSRKILNAFNTGFGSPAIVKAANNYYTLKEQEQKKAVSL